MRTLKDRLTALEIVQKSIVQTPPDFSRLSTDELKTLRVLWQKIESLPKINGKADLSGLTDAELEELRVLTLKIEGVSDGND